MNNSTAIWLYGSRARGDSTSASDFDVLVIGTMPDSEVAKIFDKRAESLSISRYSWDEIEGMKAYGSLFLHHLRDEGRVIYETEIVQGKFAKLVKHLPAYRKAKTDLEGFRQTILDVRSSIANGGSAPFELSVLATVMRHSAILACYFLGKPKFGREEPVQTALKDFGFDPIMYDWFRELYQFRLFMDGRADRAPSSSKTVIEWCTIIELFLSKMEVIVD
jgi:predicted nucleotidyltransferase